MRGSAVFFGLLFFVSGAFSSSQWRYGDEKHWPEVCRNGKRQSPINFESQNSVDATYEKFVFSHYSVGYPATVKNNGHSVAVKIATPYPSVKGGGLPPKEYILDHLHFHWKSEHTLDKFRFPLEVHLVHYASDYGNLSTALNYKDGVAVLAVFYDLSPDDDVQFEPLIEVMKNVEKSPNAAASHMEGLHANSFLPRDTAGFYRYNGSLTTPDCSEVVTWTVFTNTISISKEQLDHFESIYSDTGVLKANYRSLQDLEGRIVYRKVSPLRHSTAAPNFDKLATSTLLIAFSVFTVFW